MYSSSTSSIISTCAFLSSTYISNYVPLLYVLLLFLLIASLFLFYCWFSINSSFLSLLHITSLLNSFVNFLHTAHLFSCFPFYILLNFPFVYLSYTSVLTFNVAKLLWLSFYLSRINHLLFSCYMAELLMAWCRSQLTSLVSAVLLLSVLLYLGPYFEPLPVCVLGAIIMVSLTGLLLKVSSTTHY